MASRISALILIVALSASTVGCGGDDPDATTAASSTTSPAINETTSSSPEATTSTAAPDPGGDDLVLRGDGLGVAVFGDSAETVGEELAAVLGPPDRDEVVPCDADPSLERRISYWGNFKVEFVTGGFTGWTLRDDPGEGEMQAITTDAGIGVGSAVEDLTASYPGQVAIGVSDLRGPVFLLGIPDPLYGIEGWLTATEPTGTISFMAAGGGGCDSD